MFLPGVIFKLFPPQCLQPGQPCDSLPLDSFLMMMLDTKTVTKPLVVVDGPTEHPGQCADFLLQGGFFIQYGAIHIFECRF